MQSNLISIGVFLGVLLVFYILKAVIIVRLKTISEKTKNDIDDFFIDILRSFRLIFGATAAFVIAFIPAGINPFTFTVISVLVIAVATYQVAKSVGVIFTFVIKKTRGFDQSTASAQGLKTIINLFVWIIGALVIMSAIGYNINSIIAGLGIGGIAVAFALQNVLGDVFSSFAIYFDRPFNVGDYILVGDIEGTVEKIGMKSTRIRSLRGEEIVMSNRLLTDVTVQNFGRLERRRVLTTLGLAYETPNAQLEKIPDAIQKIIESIDQAEFERIYFKTFGDSALVYELTYHVNSSDFNTFTKIKHEINLQIKAWLEKQNITIAYPTQQIYISK